MSQPQDDSYLRNLRSCLQFVPGLPILIVIRVADWLAQKPRAVTRIARFERVMLGTA